MERVGIRELECLVAVADNLSFCKAARQLHLSQPPLTRQIQALEEKLGTRIFTRNAHAVTLTKAGVHFLEEARAILRHVDHATAAIRDDCPEELGHLRLAFIGALADAKLIRLIQKFRSVYPASLLELSNLYPSAQLNALQAGTLDGGFIGTRPEKPINGLAFIDWIHEPLILALPQQHPLARIRQLRWQHLQGLPWVLLSQQDAPAHRRHFSKITESHALAPQIVQESNTVKSVLVMVAAGIGISMVPLSVKQLITSGIVYRRFPSPQPIAHYTFAYRAGQNSPALDKFLSLLAKSVK